MSFYVICTANGDLNFISPTFFFVFVQVARVTSHSTSSSISKDEENSFSLRIKFSKVFNSVKTEYFVISIQTKTTYIAGKKIDRALLPRLNAR